MKIETYKGQIVYIKAQFDDKSLISYSTEDKGLFLVNTKEIKEKGK